MAPWAEEILQDFLTIFEVRFLQIFGITCLSGGYQDLLLGFYQLCALISLGTDQKPTMQCGQGHQAEKT